MKVTRDNDNNIVYIYDAIGSKLKRQSVEGGVITSRYYAGLVEYENNTVLIHTDEGVANGFMVNDTLRYTFKYHLKDHLGNIRAAFEPSGDTLILTQVNDYYPFGMVSSSKNNGTNNKYLYNGKEIQDGLGLEWYDYGARFYDAQIGRFTTQDPMAESHGDYTPYHYTFNNPLTFIDLFGLDTIPANSSQEIKKGDVIQGDDGQFYTMNSGEVEVTAEKEKDKGEDKEVKPEKVLPEVAMLTGDKQDFTGFFGAVKYFLTGGYIDGFSYDRDGNCNGLAPNMGFPPIPTQGSGFIKLTGGGKSILGNLKNLKDIRLADAIKIRGGTGSNINHVATWLQGKTVAEVANEAAKGNAEAKTAIKILKEAGRLSKKY